MKNGLREVHYKQVIFKTNFEQTSLVHNNLDHEKKMKNYFNSSAFFTVRNV